MASSGKRATFGKAGGKEDVRRTQCRCHLGLPQPVDFDPLHGERARTPAGRGKGEARFEDGTYLDGQRLVLAGHPAHANPVTGRAGIGIVGACRMEQGRVDARTQDDRLAPGGLSCEPCHGVGDRHERHVKLRPLHA